MVPWLIRAALVVMVGVPAAGAAELLKPPQIWADYDPNKGDFKQEIVKEETKDGFYYRESYISAYVLGEEIRVYCQYKVKAGAVKAPGLLNVHGWMGAAAIDNDFVRDGWAVMSFDYCGKNGDRKQYTKYPDNLSHGNMTGPVIHSDNRDRNSITDPTQASDYIWYAIQRRVLSYLEQQKEVDKARLGAKGYSYGGTLMWNLGMDPRVKAIVAYFGIGYTEYYRNKQVWMYNVPYLAPPKTPGEEIFLAGIAPESHGPYITAAALWLNGSNDHHGGHERGIEVFRSFKKEVPWDFAIQARAHHNTEKIGQDCRIWLEKYVLGKDVFWPARPKSAIRLDACGVPELVVTPASPERVKKVEIYYALKSSCSFSRSWRDTACIAKDGVWVAKMPVMNVEDYVFGYANITYDTTVVVSTDFNAAIPSQLGPAKATDTNSEVISTGDGMGAWTDVASAEGVGGIKGFRAIDNHKGTGTEQLNDPKWQPPSSAKLALKFYCTEPQKLILTAATYNHCELEITASDNWQEMVVPAGKLINKFSKQPLKSWSGIGSIHFKPAPGADITKVVFAEFKWVMGSSTKDERAALPPASGPAPRVAVNVDWRAFLDRHDLVMERPAKDYFEAPFVGNGLVGAMIWQESASALRLEIGRTDVTDHRTEPDKLDAAVRKGRLPIGSFLLTTQAEIAAGTMRVRLYDAEAVGTLTTDKGSLSWRLIAHARLPILVMEVTTTGGESASWQWKPAVSVVPRAPDKSRTNPPPTLGQRDGVSFCLQARTAGGDYCTAWTEVAAADTRRLLVTIADDWPKAGSDATAVTAIAGAKQADFAALLQVHRDWWHTYYPANFLSVPDIRMESFYWIQMYKLGSSIRKGGPLCDLLGPWYKPTGWPAIWFNLNTQVLFLPLPSANRLEMAENLSDALQKNLPNLIANVPKEFQHDSAGVSRLTGTDLLEKFDRWKEYGNLTWTCHNLWLQYRHSMDERFLREQLYPLLRRSINMYLHLLTQGDDGHYHMPPAHCPESFSGPDNNYDLSSIRWGCDTLLAICKRLKIDDPLIPKWEEVQRNLVPFSRDEHGFSGGPGKAAPRGHRHWSHMLMIYPYYTINWDQPENRNIIERTWQWWADPRVPNAWSQAAMSSVASMMNRGDDALQCMQRSLNSRNIASNTMHTEGGNPCSETHGIMCQMLHDMLMTSWGDRIRIFPGVPVAWKDLVFHDLRAEGAFLVSARRTDGKTLWVRINSLAGEPCRAKLGFSTEPKLLVNGKPVAFKRPVDGVYELPLAKGNEAILYVGDKLPDLSVRPLPIAPKDANPWGVKNTR